MKKASLFLAGILGILFCFQAWGGRKEAPLDSLAVDLFQQWNTFMGGTSSNDIANDIALDPSGNIYVAGDSEATWGVPVNPFTGDRDVFVAKLNSNGAREWHTFLCPSQSWTDINIAVDGSGNSYVIGSSAASWGAPISPHSVGTDTFVAKLNTDGELQWNTFLGTCTYFDFRGSIALDSSGNIYVTGCSMMEWGAPILPFNGGQDAIVVKLNNSGVRQWNTFLGSPGGDLGEAIAVTSAGDIYVAGRSQTTWGTPVHPHSGFGKDEVFVAKLDGNGVLQWHTFMGSAADDNASAITVDATGNVFIAGVSAATWGTPVNPFAGGNWEAFAAKLDSVGNLIWNSFLGGSSGDFPSREIAVDEGGNVYVGGSSFATWGTPILPYLGGSDAFLAKLDGNGVRQWNAFIGSVESEGCHSFARDASGHFYLTGPGQATWGTPVNPHAGGDSYTDAFVAKLITQQTYAFSGFDSPIDNPPIVNNAKAGSVIPVKWRITDLDGTPISDPASFQSLTSFSVSCGSFSGDPVDALDEYSPGSSGLQYFGDGYWQFNWKTLKTYKGQCRIMVLTLADGSTHSASFSFK